MEDRGEYYRCYNCYQSSEIFVANKKLYKSFILTSDNPELESILDSIKKQYIEGRGIEEKGIEKGKPLIYKFVLRVSGVYKERILCFNHSFVIKKVSGGYELCDSWQGIHKFKCRKKDFVGWFNKLSEDLLSYNISEELIDFFKEPYDVPEGEYINMYPCPVSKVPRFTLDINIYLDN